MIRHENDVIRLLEPITATVIGKQLSLVIPAGAEGSVVLVYGNPVKPDAYEIEFYVHDHECFALATIEATKV